MLLASPFSYPLHVGSWNRPKGSVDYRVTNPFDGPDFVNGGKHQATDVGNTRQGDTLRSPAACQGIGMRHPDGSRGNRLNLGYGISLDFWHLDATLRTERWTPLAVGQSMGTTGSSGPRIGDGKGGTVPMPAHTHMRAERDGVPFDIESHLPMVERAAIPLPLIEEEDVIVKTPIVTQEWITKAGPEATFTRSDGSTGHFTTPERVKAIASVILPGGVNGRLLDYGPNHEALTIPFSGLAESVRGTQVIGSPVADCSRERNALERIATASEGAKQAIDIIEGLARP